MKKVLLLLILKSTFLFSITLVPLIETISSNKNKNPMFTVENPTAEPVAVTFSVKKATLTEEGEEIHEETSKVIYYPAQFILNPKETKKVRLKYMATVLPKKEEVYRIFAKELDIDVEDKKQTSTNNKVSATIKLRYSYEGLLFVHREGAVAHLKINHIKQINSGINVSIENSGDASAIPWGREYNYFIKVGNKEYLLSENDLKGISMGRVLAKSRRFFYFKNINSVDVGQITSMRIEKKK